MTDRAAFGRLVRALEPWCDRLLFVGGWAHRLHRLHPQASVLAYPPLATLDADVAFGRRVQLDGDICQALKQEGFEQELTGENRPPVSRYILGDDTPTGFYAEFLTPLMGPSHTADGRTLATVAKSGITAQQLRFLDLLFHSPWEVTLGEDWGADSPVTIRIPNPVVFVAQKLLIHEGRSPEKRSQDLLYIHDTIELFAAERDQLQKLWRDDVLPRVDPGWVRRLSAAREEAFGTLSDTLRDAARIPQDRDLDPERMRAMCLAVLGEIFD